MTHTAAQAERDQVVARLAVIPGRIACVVGEWDPARLAAPPVAGGWSARAILAHLRAADDIVAPRAYMILARDNPPLAAYDERRWAEIASYDQADFFASLAVYTARRTELVSALRRLAPKAWARTGSHEARGQMSLLEVLRGLAEHEEEHAAQIDALAR